MTSYTLTPNPTTHNIQIHVNGEFKGEAISYLLADKMAQEMTATPQCSTPACGFSATYQCFKCQKNLCPAHALKVGRGFIYCGLCAPEAKAPAKKQARRKAANPCECPRCTASQIATGHFYCHTEKTYNAFYDGLYLGTDSNPYFCQRIITDHRFNLLTKGHGLDAEQAEAVLEAQKVAA